MATANFVKKARKNIYENGKTVTYISKKGKRKGHKLEKTDVTIPENKKDKILIKAGESYWWWQFAYGGKNYSKTRPKASQLTRSAYLGTIYDIGDRIGDLRGVVTDADGFASEVEDIISELENLKEETESSLENMPDQLQESDTGQLLQERIDALDNAISELEGIDCDYSDETDEDATEEEKEEALSTWLDEKCEELSNVSFE